MLNEEEYLNKFIAKPGYAGFTNGRFGFETRNQASICPHCNAKAQQAWYNVEGYQYKLGVNQLCHFPTTVLEIENLIRPLKYFMTVCASCESISFYKDEVLIYPSEINHVHPIEEMPDDIKKIFNEANSVLSISPKSSAALSRLGLEMLLHHLNYHGKSIDSSIKKAVEQGLSPKIQKAMDTLRVIGNNSVHPGQIDVHDDKETAKTLLLLLNVIVEHQITTPNMIDSLFDELPEGAKKHIEKRDKN